MHNLSDVVLVINMIFNSSLEFSSWSVIAFFAVGDGARLCWVGGVPDSGL
jgi:hypothetical protein